ncbi:hypothetical protein [Roseateles depolymerans]|uniref:Uncharacterized protein n=1 Tax=Roseateles depolymerans TaxID=76731 RepID=A0A0U3N397_9BURK|nr:hypothetical protein [Roseateles depolymerans]ALV06683.1 hypothetical protein RD2015_2211 [Roseateles depolymerans]REG19660.1 hypothetical protein DES44_2160 [Roseateles depolymerans]
MNHHSKNFCCDGSCNQGRECPQRLRIKPTSAERDAAKGVVATAYRKGLLDVFLTLFAVLACASVVSLFGVAP